MKNPKSILIFCLLLVSNFLFSQKTNNTFEAELSKLNYIADALEELSPFEEDEWELIDSLNVLLSEKLVQFLSREEIENFPKDSLPFFTSQSSDHQVALFSWDLNMGGTYQPFINILYFQHPTEGAQAIELTEEFDAYFYAIHKIKNPKNEKIYLLMGNGKACSTCFFDQALLFKIDRSGFQELFSHRIQYRMYSESEGIWFDNENQILYFDFFEECSDENDAEQKWCQNKGAWKFDGNNFSEILFEENE